MVAIQLSLSEPVRSTIKNNKKKNIHKLFSEFILCSVLISEESQRSH